MEKKQRRSWKTPYIHHSIYKKIQESKGDTKKAIKTWSRSSTILPIMLNYTFLVHNGKKFIKVKIHEKMVGHKLGEFATTRRCSFRLPVRTLPFHGKKMGSIPIRNTRIPQLGSLQR